MEKQTSLPECHVDFTPLHSGARSRVVKSAESKSVDGSELVIVMPDVEDQIEDIRFFESVKMVFGELQLFGIALQRCLQFVDLTL